MKFCTKCGNELFDEAIVCTKCGCMVGQTPINVQSQSNVTTQCFVPTNQKKPSSLPIVFNFIFDLFAILYFFIISITVFTVWVICDAKTKIVSQYNTATTTVNAYLFFDESGSVLATLVAIVCAILGLTSLILAVSYREKKENMFSTIKRLILGVFFIIISLYI